MLAVLAISATAILKQWKADFLPLIRIGVAVLLGTLVITRAAPLFSYLRLLTDHTGMSEHAQLLFKALGLALLTQICADICRECGESGIAGGVELTGKIEILLLCLPLFTEILEIARTLLDTGGAV